MKIAFYTLGCKVNQYESQAMAETLEKDGHEIVNIESSPDVIIINSCTVTAESDRKTRQTIRKHKKKNPDCTIVLTGCMAQAFPEKAKEMAVDLVLGNTDQSNIAELLKLHLEKKQRIIDIKPHKNDEAFKNTTISKFNERTRAYMKIEDGCNRFCSYCIIPTARGRVRSRSIESIKQEAERLAKNGFCEIVLVGINLSAYGLGTDLELCDAVKAVSETEGIKRVRLGSLEPDQISERTFTYLKNCEKFCPQFHLSLQSGCDKTLKAMNRHYDTAFYRDLIKKIRSTFTNPAITTDIMVGFAGETEEDFNKSLEFAKEIGFSKAHIFAYSRREGTAAFNRNDQIENAVKAERSKKMIEVCEKAEYDFHLSQVGKVSSVLFETKENGYWYGFSENYTRIKVKSDEELAGKIINVKINYAQKDLCEGEIL